MKIFEGLGFFSIIIFLLFCAFGWMAYINYLVGLEDDNPIEEFIEDVVEMQTGMKVDLTPISIER